MAKIKIKLGDNEIEIDSRDFYVDNQSLGEVIESISKHLPESSAKIVYGAPTQEQPNYENSIPTPQSQSVYDGLDSLQDAEMFEPEFDKPKYVSAHELKPKLKILETASFFNSPRSVTETVQKLSEYGWTASPLDVSKELAKMAMNRKMTKSSQENRNYYSINKPVLIR